MKKILFILLSFHSFAFANSELFYIESTKAIAIAENVIKDRKPEIFSKGLKLKELKHEFDVQGDVASKQMLKITFLYSESKSGMLLNTQTVSVVLDRLGNVLGVLMGRSSETIPRYSDLDPAKVIQACKVQEDYHSELLNLAEYCKYSTERCPALGDSNAKINAVCTEDSLSMCFENKKWVSISKYFGEAPNLEIIRVSRRMGNTESCALFKRP